MLLIYSRLYKFPALCKKYGDRRKKYPRLALPPLARPGARKGKPKDMGTKESLYSYNLRKNRFDPNQLELQGFTELAAEIREQNAAMQKKDAKRAQKRKE